MKTNLDHLPEKQQREISRVVEILHEEFEDIIALSTHDWKRKACILRIVLFGSYARGTWVDDHHQHKSYQSDFDLLIIVNYHKLTDVAEFWARAEDCLIRDPSIGREVNFIVHTLQDVNDALAQSQYFFSDIVQEGIELYNLEGTKPFISPKPLTSDMAYDVATRYFDHRFSHAENALKLSRRGAQDNMPLEAAFLLHQAVERLYGCYLLVRTNYLPMTHNVKFLRSLSESYDTRLIDIWPRETKKQDKLFELLKRAYVEARYSEHYKITEEDLVCLTERVTHLKEIVEMLCQEHLASLKNKVERTAD